MSVKTVNDVAMGASTRTPWLALKTYVINTNAITPAAIEPMAARESACRYAGIAHGRRNGAGEVRETR